MLVIFPPDVQTCEPPAGIAKLAGAFGTHGISCCVLDANVKGFGIRWSPADSVRIVIGGRRNA